MKRAAWATVTLFALGHGVAGAKPATVDGKAVYMAHCARCHGADGHGQEGKVPPLAGSEFMHESAAKRVGIVLQGLKGPIDVKGRPYRGHMPPRSHLSDAEIAAVLNYVGRAWGNRADPVSEKQVRGYRFVMEQGTPAEKWREHPSLFKR